MRQSWAMYYGASPQLFNYAKILRRTSTETERLLWNVLNNGGYKSYHFRRQHPIFIYIADFYSHPCKMVVELDGKYHLRKGQKEYDGFRDEDMAQFGIQVLRFSDEDVLKDHTTIIEKITHQAQQRLELFKRQRILET